MLSPSLEDYLEEIYRLSLIKSEIRVRDIAEKLKVSSPSVVKALRKLHNESYILYKRYEGIYLTQEGEKLGKLLVKRNSVLQEFLSVINSQCDVEAEAEAMEHYLSSPTILSIEKLVAFMKKDREILNKFLKFCGTEEKKHWSEELE
ncbi:metal-dependent transcriptional regulator [Crassaminicella profunda]|uniref:metal-dependent transcriptional regulator n=1 Tax=Crassaminicella profunda TaxID=1286698 RepID=UPI001CA60262|nr:iron dependent repressor, metal binding and dimerization domain protein [Crassaminicella profunda]QZY56139.1 DNA-binding protein [Crassaminicella profunda]